MITHPRRWRCRVQGAGGGPNPPMLLNEINHLHRVYTLLDQCAHVKFGFDLGQHLADRRERLDAVAQTGCNSLDRG